MPNKHIWHSPSFCGCTLFITAEWAHEPSGVNQYAFPVPGTISDIQITSICDEHKSLKDWEVPADYYQGSPGYLAIPEKPTEAQKVFIYLYRYSGGAWSPDTCGCHIAVCLDRFTGEQVSVHHPVHTMHCVHHAHLDHKEAHEVVAKENIKKNMAVNPIHELDDFSQLNIDGHPIPKPLEKILTGLGVSDFSSFGEVSRTPLTDKVTHYFDENRNLVIMAHGISEEDKKKIQSIHSEIPELADVILL